MGVAANKSDIEYILREHIESGAYEDLIVEDDSFIAWLNKNDNGGGLYDRKAFTDRPNGGTGWSFEAAQAGKMAAGGDDWHIDWFDLFSLFSITHKAFRYNRKSADRLEEMVKIELTQAAKRFRTLLGFALWGNGTGMIDEIANLSAGNYIDITNRHATFVLAPNMELEHAADDGIAAGGVDPNDIVRIDDVVNSGLSRRILGNFGAAWTAGDFIFPRDAYNNVVQGVEAWCPLTAPTGTFNGVLRTNRPLRYGVIFDPTGLPITNFVEFLNWMATIYFEENPDESPSDLAFWMNPRTAAVLTDVLGVKLRYEASEIATNSRGEPAMNRKGEPITIGKSYLATAAGGEIPIMTHRHIRFGRVSLLCRESMELSSMGALFAPIDDYGDASSTVVHQSENAFEERMGGYPNLVMASPHRNAVGDATAFLPDIA